MNGNVGDKSVSLVTPAAVTDHSSYELGVLMERERCAKIADTQGSWCLPEFSYDAGFAEACKQIAAAIRDDK